VGGLIIFTENITARKRAEMELAFGERKFSAAFTAAPYAMVISELESGLIVDVNEAFLTWTGFSREETLGRSAKKLHLWPQPDQRDQMVALSKAHGSFASIPAQIRLKNGDIRHVLFSGATFRVSSHNYLVNTAQDVTDKQRLEQERQLSMSLLQATLESTADAILVVDTQGRMERWNQQFIQLWAIPEDIAASRDDTRTLHHVLSQLKDPESFLARVRELYGKPEEESFDTIEFKDGRVIERYSQPQRLDGKVVGRVWNFRDVTQRVKAEQELARLLGNERKTRAEAETANKAKDDFLAIVSHELRTPLTAILGWSWLLRAGKLSDQERQNALDIIVRNMQSQRQIVEDLIDISSITRGHFNLARDTFDLTAILESVCASLAQQALSRGIRLVLDLPGPTGVMGDSGRLQQVFWNLMNNAMKFSPDGGEVRVSLRREAEQSIITVRDSGKGIQPEFMPHLFEPFRQGEDPLIREHRGLGLGLAIVKRIVELHGGTVSAASAGENRGAILTVRLPAAAWPPPGRAVPESQTEPDAHSLDGLNVLVVEDEVDMRRLLNQLLSRFGARVTTAADASEAWASLEKSVPDLMLCDIAMPGEDGCALINKVRNAGGKLGLLPSAALTALAREEDRARALKAGFQAYLVKPMELPQLLEAVRALVGRR
jgi:PAS domain S-box-containing protein